VPGFACSRQDWEAQVSAFSKSHDVIACDLRGHGETPGTPADCTIENFGADVAALLESLDLSGAILIGHSMGCRVVLQAALDAPDRVAALVLVDGSRLGSADPVAAERAAADAIRTAGYRNFVRQLFADMFTASSDPGLKSETVERALRLPESIGAALFPRIARWDAANMKRALSTLKARLMVIQSTLIIPGKGREPLSPGQTTPWLDLVRRLVPAARIEIVPGVGHFPQLEAAATVNRLIAEFCQKL
jgi:pimeloyl-ACP methyl ester carboxylesterase